MAYAPHLHPSTLQWRSAKWFLDNKLKITLSDRVCWWFFVGSLVCFLNRLKDKLFLMNPSHDPFQMELFEVLLQWDFTPKTNQCWTYFEASTVFSYLYKLCSSTTC